MNRRCDIKEEIWLIVSAEKWWHQIFSLFRIPRETSETMRDNLGQFSSQFVKYARSIRWGSCRNKGSWKWDLGEGDEILLGNAVWEPIIGPVLESIITVHRFKVNFATQNWTTYEESCSSFMIHRKESLNYYLKCNDEYRLIQYCYSTG